jgi:hypothetical protein
VLILTNQQAEDLAHLLEEAAILLALLSDEWGAYCSARAVQMGGLN